jgi:4-amino-4-deoxy-L-arabinose transferase-like glycosyltransferase
MNASDAEPQSAQAGSPDGAGSRHARAASIHGPPRQAPAAPAWLVPAALAIIVLAAIALRFAALDANPGGLFPDEAAEGLDARRILHDPGFRPVFLAGDGGREALFAYVVAAMFSLLGETTFVLRATAAGLGVAGVLAIWLLARRFGTGAGLAAAAWAAGSLWLVCVSRDGMRNVLVPLFGALALWALMRWLERRSQGGAILAGALTALATLYTYQPLKLLPLVIAIWLLWLRRVDRHTWAGIRPNLAAFVAVFLGVAAPMVVAAVADPANYFGRAVAVTPLNPDVGAGGDLASHVLRTLAMFAVTGDPNPRHDVAGLPLLGWPVFLVALAGLARLWARRRDALHALIGLSLPVFLLPPLVATEGGSPHFLRSLGLAAPLAVAIGLGAVEIVERVGAMRGARAARIGAFAVAAGFAVLAAGSGIAYQGRPVADRYEAYSYPLVALADAARRSPPSAVIVSDYDAMVVRFLDAASLPAILAPPDRLPAGTTVARVLALQPDDLAAATGASAGARPVAWDPGGRPVVWEASP